MRLRTEIWMTASSAPKCWATCRKWRTWSARRWPSPDENADEPSRILDLAALLDTVAPMHATLDQPVSLAAADTTG